MKSGDGATGLDRALDTRSGRGTGQDHLHAGLLKLIKVDARTVGLKVSNEFPPLLW